MIRSSSPWILGISASHNGSVCLLCGDEIVVAVQEERLVRTKRAPVFGGLGSLALNYCLQYADIHPFDLSAAVLCGQLHNKTRFHDLALNPSLQLGQHNIPIITISHHMGHATSTFAVSGFRDAAVLVVDGEGSPYIDLSAEERSQIKTRVIDGREKISWYSAVGTTIAAVEKHLAGRDRLLELDSRTGLLSFVGMPRFNSLGYMYAAVGHQIFGQIADGPGKVMGLAPYGQPTIPVSDFFEIVSGDFRFSDKVCKRFPHNDRWPLRQKEYQDLAASVQVALEEALLYLVRHIRHHSDSDNLCYAGGVALNSVANERIIRESGFKNVFITPAAEDSGTAVGAAYYGLWHLTKKNSQRVLVSDGLGRNYSSAEITEAIARTPAVRHSRPASIISETVDLLCDGKIIGWFQGRSELGPRALGQRSIICDPRQPNMQEVLNMRVKHRESFRPFAPAILLEECGNWFDMGSASESPYMLRVCRFKAEKREQVPSVVHIDGTGRLQTVTGERNGIFYELVREFFNRTGVPILLNTSFNVAGEPIVETPMDALGCLLFTELDCCILGEYLVRKNPNYSSILDLHIRIVAEAASLYLPQVDGELGLPNYGVDAAAALYALQAYGGAREIEPAYYERDFGFRIPPTEHIRFSVTTQWGPAVQATHIGALMILKWVNGQRTGWQIQELLSESLGIVLDAAALVHALGVLHRAFIISFHDGTV